MRKSFYIPPTRYTRAVRVWFGWHQESGFYFDILIRGRLAAMLSTKPAPNDGKRVWIGRALEEQRA